MQSEFLDGRVSMEGSSGGSVEEGDKDAGFVGYHSDGFDGTESDKVHEFVDRCFCGGKASVMHERPMLSSAKGCYIKRHSPGGKDPTYTVLPVVFPAAAAAAAAAAGP